MTFKLANKAKFVFLLIITLILGACDHNAESTYAEASITHSEKEHMLKLMLDHPNLQQYMHPNLDGRVPVKIKSNDLLGTNLVIEKFGKQVEFVDSIVPSGTIPVFEVVSFNINNDRANFELVYEIEGVTMKGTLIKKNASHWSFANVEIYEL